MEPETARTPNLYEDIRQMAFQVAGAALWIALRDNSDYVMPDQEAVKVTEGILRDFGLGQDSIVGAADGT